MFANIRACLWLLVLTVLICCVMYPLALWAVGQTLFPAQANGSLLYDEDGKAIGSRLIAQEFKDDRYFQPRPSAASYNGAVSGATNWGANNYKLRDRVARSVAGLVQYRSGPNKGQDVAPDVVKWFRAGQPGLAATWAKDHSSQKADANSEDIASVFFDAWRQAHADADLTQVPSDMVTASASGLDPHLTLESALFQADRVAGKWAELTKQDLAKVRAEIETLVRQHKFAPMAGLAGGDLINVLEVNLALRSRFAGKAQATSVSLASRGR
jgi:K+-transporting ATPase KdpC subunit